MSSQHQLWAVLGGLFVISVALIGSLTAPSAATKPAVTLLVLAGVGIAIHDDRQGRPHH